ncbi:MAG: hypothetical protein R3F24_09260 [Gammaproteobacteria bacterium]
MAKPNYNYQKKQKELARAAKQAEKRQRRQQAKNDAAPADNAAGSADITPAPAPPK